MYVSVGMMVTMSGESSCALSLANSLLSAGRQAGRLYCMCCSGFLLATASPEQHASIAEACPFFLPSH